MMITIQSSLDTSNVIRLSEKVWITVVVLSTSSLLDHEVTTWCNSNVVCWKGLDWAKLLKN